MEGDFDIARPEKRFKNMPGIFCSWLLFPAYYQKHILHCKNRAILRISQRARKLMYNYSIVLMPVLWYVLGRVGRVIGE